MDRGVPASLSAVVVNYNGGDKVIRVIEALGRHAPMIEHVVVADNGSTDASLATIRERFPAVEILELGANLGLPNARNAGLERATGRYVLLLDADIYVTEGCVEALLDAAHRYAAAVVCPRIVRVPDGSIVQCDGAEPHVVGTLALLNPDAALSAPPVAAGPVRGLIGAAMLVDRRAVLDAGGFNELYFFYFEDLEFSLRMRLLGHEVVRAPAGIVEHERGQGHAGLSFRGKGSYPPRRAYLGMRNRLLTVSLCYSGRTLVLLVPVLLAYEIATLSFAVSRGFVKEWCAAWRWLVANRAVIGRERRALQARRVRPDRDLLGTYWRLVARWT